MGTTPRYPDAVQRQPVHPHTRGDNTVDCVHTPSSVRFTPTRVGTTDASMPTLASDAVHPHTRGDNVATCGAQSCRVAVHPHTRGDNVDGRELMAPVDGSPPHAWGQQVVSMASAEPAGSPPHAWGQRRPGSRRCQLSGSPPHAWGQLESALARRLYGSPPHAWGQRFHRFAQPSQFAVHPHTRGDNADWPRQFRSSDGSPPHAWGQLSRTLGRIRKSLSPAMSPPIARGGATESNPKP